MSQELQLGRYEFYPYPEEFIEPPPTLGELVEVMRKSKTESKKDAKAPSTHRRRTLPRRKRS